MNDVSGEQCHRWMEDMRVGSLEYTSSLDIAGRKNPWFIRLGGFCDQKNTNTQHARAGNNIDLLTQSSATVHVDL